MTVKETATIRLCKIYWLVVGNTEKKNTVSMSNEYRTQNH